MSGQHAQKRATRRGRRHRGGASLLPVTTWGPWSELPGALATGPGGAQLPPPIANGGMYTGAQSTGGWASSPFPATQYAWAVEAARISGNPAVFYQQRAADNGGASFSPFVHTPISSNHTVSAMRGGSKKRRHRKQSKRINKRRS